MNILIVDGNAIGYAAHSTKPLTVEGVGEVQAVFQSLKMLKKVKERFQDFQQILWLWDGKAQFRYDLWPEYKGNRRDTAEKREIKDKYQAVKPFLEQILAQIGVQQVLSPNFEADDLAGFYCRQAARVGGKVQLITGDGDWVQLVSPTVAWLDPRTTADKFVNHENFTECTGFNSVGKFLMHKALMGDPSDNIPSVGIGDAVAAKLIAHFGGIKEMLAAYKSHGGFTKDNLPEELSRERNKFNAFCASGVPLFRRNYQLMNLHDESRDDAIRGSVSITRSAFNASEFEYLCRSLRFMSIVRELERWEELFSRKKKVTQ